MREFTLAARGWLVTNNTSGAVYPDGLLGIVDDRVVYAGPSVPYTAKDELTCPQGVIIPGLVNCHTHAAMAYFKGWAEDLPLDRWLQDHIWPAEAHFLTPEFVREASRQACAEMIAAGITSFADMYFYARETAQAVDEAGLRAILGEGVLDFAAGPHKNGAEMIQYTVDAAREWAGHPRVKFAIAPHAVYSCGKDNLRAAAEAARANHLLMHVHLSETRWEQEHWLQKQGCTPTAWLQQLGVLDNQCVAAHGVWCNPEDRDILKKHGTYVAINTKSNLKLGSGIAPVKEYLEEGVTLCLGTDGSASNNRLDMLDELSFFTKLHKGVNHDPALLPAGQALNIATAAGARALGWQNVGRLQEGWKADFAVLSARDLTAMPMYDPRPHLIHSMGSGAVVHTVVDGRVLYKNRSFTTLDIDKINEAARRHQRELAGFKKA